MKWIWKKYFIKHCYFQGEAGCRYSPISVEFTESLLQCGTPAEAATPASVIRYKHKHNGPKLALPNGIRQNQKGNLSFVSLQKLRANLIACAFLFADTWESLHSAGAPLDCGVSRFIPRVGCSRMIQKSTCYQLDSIKLISLLSESIESKREKKVEIIWILAHTCDNGRSFNWSGSRLEP